MSKNDNDIYLDDEIEVKPSRVKIVIDRKDGDGTFSIHISNPNNVKGSISSTGKTYVLGSEAMRYGKLKVSVMVTRDNK